MPYIFSNESITAVGTGLANAFAKRGTTMAPQIWDLTWNAYARDQLMSWASSPTDSVEAGRRDALLVTLSDDFG